MLGERMRTAREKRGLTQEQLGVIVHVTDATINRYELNLRRPTPEMLNQLAEALGTSADYLLSRTVDPGPITPGGRVISFRTDGLTEADERDLAGYFEWLREKRKRVQQKDKDRK